MHNSTLLLKQTNNLLLNDPVNKFNIRVKAESDATMRPHTVKNYTKKSIFVSIFPFYNFLKKDTLLDSDHHNLALG